MYINKKKSSPHRNKPVKSGHLLAAETYLWSICTCRNTSRRRTCASDTFCRRSSRPARAPYTIRRRSCHGIALETHTDRRRRSVGNSGVCVHVAVPIICTVGRRNRIRLSFTVRHGRHRCLGTVYIIL